MRNAAALMEFVFCLPLLLTITFGTIETCRMMYLKQSLKIAAYETARLAILPGVTPADLQEHCELFLTSRHLEGHQLRCQPADPNDAQFGDLIRITVTMPAEANALVGAWFYQGDVLVETANIMAEY